MHVYFVRHGLTQLNQKHIHQSPNTPLAPNGCDAVLNIAEELRAVNPDLIITSEYTRALETARLIGARTGLTPRIEGLFYEVVRPSKLYHTSIFSLETAWYMLRTFLKRKDPTWRYYDAENFTDIEHRAKKAITYLESLADTHASVIVVSHTVFLHIVISYLCRNRMLDLRDLIQVCLSSKKMKNGSMIHATYTKETGPGTCAWVVDV